MAATKQELGKRKSTLQSGTLTVQTFENGLRIAKRGGTEVVLDVTDASILACHIREFSSPRLFTEPELRILLRMAGVENYREHIEKYDGLIYEEKWPG